MSAQYLQGKWKILQKYFDNMKHNSTTPDAFIGVM